MSSTNDRSHLFPATFIGRTQGSGLQRVSSSDSLSAHPLLSSNSPSNRSASPTNSNPRYIPYTPRQRVSPTTVTTGTTVHPPSPQQHGDAASKLQFVNLKAAAQNIGLDTGSVGWAILEKLVQESDRHDAEWTEVWNTVTSGKSTLLLPLEQVNNHDKLTAEFVKDHIIFCDGSSRNNAPIITLSGLRGTLNDNTLTFRSTLHPSSKTFQDLLTPSNRPFALKILPDLPDTQTSSSPSYPSFVAPSYHSALPLPPRNPSAPNKPPLPPRPSNRTFPSNNPSSTTSRISNPFASLFGGGGMSKASPVAAPPSPTSSLRSLESMHPPTEPVVDVAAFTIDRRIVRREVAKEMNKALRRELKGALALGDAPLPGWIVDRVHDFAADWYPFVKDRNNANANSALGLGEKKLSREGVGSPYVVTWAEEPPDSTAARMQDFYLALEQDMRISNDSFLGQFKKEHSDQGEWKVGEDEKRAKSKIDIEGKIKEVTEVVEDTICSLFYDRLYMQPTSDDSSHDEALSSRVAALNMLDLGLEHLDLHVEDNGPELDAVVRACGETLSQLQICRSPGDKATLLVAAHKIIVDGLSRLPPIRLMSEEESKAQKAKAATLAKSKAPPREPDGTLRILMPIEKSPTSAVDFSKPFESSVLERTQQSEEDLVTPHPPARQASPIPTIIEPKPESTESISHSPIPPTTPVQPASPVLTLPAPPKEATPVSGDVLLPMVIFAVVKANPPHLVSNLLYTQRYRNQSVGGEESYCLINLMAVAEFLENVDLAALGLGDSDKVLSAADLTPIPISRSPVTAATPLAAIDGVQGSIRDRVEQANKVITGVVDTSFGMLRSLLPNAATVAPATPPGGDVQDSAPWNMAKPGFGLLRRESGFSIRSITSALPIPRGASKPGAGEEAGQQLVTVSRPSSVKSASAGKDDESATDDSSAMDSNSEEEDDDDDEDASAIGDARSIRSFESMMSNRKGKKDKLGMRPRKSLTDRLAHMSSLAGLKANASTAHGANPHAPAESTSGPHTPEVQLLHLAPPIQRFVECSPGDLRLSEVGELLRDYRRLVEGIRAVRGFEE